MKQTELNMTVPCKPPTLEQVKRESWKIRLPEYEAESFWRYFNSNGWKVGRVKMVSWTDALKNWYIRWEKSQGSAPKRKSIYELSKIMEAKQKIANDLKRKWAIEVAGGTKWTLDEGRREYVKLLSEIKKINVMIASME